MLLSLTDGFMMFALFPKSKCKNLTHFDLLALYFFTGFGGPLKTPQENSLSSSELVALNCLLTVPFNSCNEDEKNAVSFILNGLDFKGMFRSFEMNVYLMED